jgi:hypothetical protein
MFLNVNSEMAKRPSCFPSFSPLDQEAQRYLVGTYEQRRRQVKIAPWRS